MMKARFGAFPVVPTTFDEKGALDLENQRRCLDFIIDAGSDGLCGRQAPIAIDWHGEKAKWGK